MEIYPNVAGPHVMHVYVILLSYLYKYNFRTVVNFRFAERHNDVWANAWQRLKAVHAASWRCSHCWDQLHASH